jgi:hypothetical protein
MIKANWLRSLLWLVLGGFLGSFFTSSWDHTSAFAQTQSPQSSLEADVEHLKDIKPPNSHPMVDVAMFAANLWFAGQKRNWSLANYYLGEMRNRMQWEVRVNPAPKGADGKPVDMQSIFEGVDNGSLSTIKKTIAMKDSKQFVVNYKQMLEDCYSCHKTNGRPYLRPMIPVSGAQPIINLDQNATWPQ